MYISAVVTTPLMPYQRRWRCILFAAQQRRQYMLVCIFVTDNDIFVKIKVTILKTQSHTWWPPIESLSNKAISIAIDYLSFVLFSYSWIRVLPVRPLVVYKAWKKFNIIVETENCPNANFRLPTTIASLCNIHRPEIKLIEIFKKCLRKWNFS